jgi:coatomer subunit beta
MEFLGDTNNPSALDVVAFVRYVSLASDQRFLNSLNHNTTYSEIVEKFPALRASICDKLISTFPEIKSGKVFRGVLWIIGEYVESVPAITETMREIRKVLGEIPILASEQRLLDEAGGEGNANDEEGESKEKEKEKAKVEGAGRPKVLADGTYATETAYSSVATARLEAVKAAAKPPLRSQWSYPLRFLWFFLTI